MTNIETMIKWMKDREGKVTYDMNNRMGPNSYDCSSAVYFSLRAGGFLPAGSMGNTDSLFGHLEQNKWVKVPLTNGSYAAKRGDIFIWGTRGASGGASGHTGIFVDSANIIHCNFGFNGITTNNHDHIWGFSDNPPVTLYRYSVPQIDLSKYFTSNPGFVKTITACSYYTNTDFTTKKSDVPKGTIVKVHAVEYSKAGYPRLKCAKGYLTANKSYVQQQSMKNYFLTNPGFIKMLQDDFYYTSASFSTKKEPIAKGVIVKVLGIEFSSLGYPRLKCAKGYLTANKSYVQQQDMKNYFLTNPGFVKMIQDDFYYTSVEFSAKKEPIAKGVIVKVLGIEFSKWGIPRLKCGKGYLTANKAYVQQQDMSNYFIANPGFVKAIQNDFYYTSAEFSTQKEPIVKGMIAKVLGIEFSKWGVPRLKCEKGYLSANKAYMQQQNMSNYFTANPGFIKVIKDDFYYTSVEFSATKEPIAKDVIVKVLAIEFSNWGIPRLKCGKGYLTANKAYVQQQDMSNYFTSNPGFVKAIKDDFYYTSTSFATKKEPIGNGVIAKVLAIEFSNWGIPRLKCENGYLSANKAYMQQQDMSNYFTTNPDFVKAIQDDFYYTSTSFATKKEAIAKGAIVKVLAIEFSNRGIPRLACEKGYLSANKAYMQQQDMSIYFMTNPGFVKLIQNDFYYTSTDFLTKKEPISKDTIVEVLAIEFSDLGYPRLVCEKGYLTANKAYVAEFQEEIAE